MTTYAEIRPLLRTGDNVFFRGKGFISNLIAFFCKSKWSHIGKIIVKKDRVLLLESTTLALDDETFKGVRLIPFSKALDFYNGRIGIKRLIMVRTPFFYERAEAFMQREIGKPYEKDAIEIINCQVDEVDWYKGKNNNNADRFCLELNAAFDIDKGILPCRGVKPANEYSFADYDDGGSVEEYHKEVFGTIRYLPMEIIK